MNLHQKTSLHWTLVTLLILAAFVAGWNWSMLGAIDSHHGPMHSRVMTWDEASSHVAKWGEMRTYFKGETFGTTNMFTAMTVVKPGESVHPAHRHAEEEFLVLTEGEGRWHLAGKEFPAKKGDVLYVEPWVFHGLINTGKQPLTFFVLRWNNQGVPPPPAPAGDHGK